MTGNVVNLYCKTCHGLVETYAALPGEARTVIDPEQFVPMAEYERVVLSESNLELKVEQAEDGRYAERSAHAEHVQAMQGEIDRLNHELATAQKLNRCADSRIEGYNGTITGLYVVIDKLIRAIQ